LRFCTEAIRRNPNDAAAYSSRGLAYEAKGDNDRAIADYSKTLELDMPTAKAGARIVVLGAPALAYLAALERIGPHVCPGLDSDKPLGKRQFYPIWRQLAAAAKLEDARPHDFRHTVGTYGAQTRANAFLIRDALGHRTLSMAGLYAGRHADPLKALADQVEGRIAAALEGKPPAEVVPLKTPVR
jgi:integrase